MGPKTKILAVGQVSNVLGVENPVKNLGKLVHKYGGYLVVDGAQSLPHMPVNVADLGADFFAFSAHKAMGPMGIGVLWGKMDLLNAMPPMLTGGEMIDSVTEQDAVWAPVPEKFEAGTQDAAGIFATGAALDYLVNTVGYENIQAREQALVHYLMGELMQLDFVRSSAPSIGTTITASSALTSRASIRTTSRASWTWTACASAPVTTARSRCSPGWASRTSPAAAPA